MSSHDAAAKDPETGLDPAQQAGEATNEAAAARRGRRGAETGAPSGAAETPEPIVQEAGHRMAAGEGTPEESPNAVDALVTEVTELRHERDELHDRLLRTSADFDNYRKRVDRERRDLLDYAAQDLLLELLPILDNFELALAADVPAGGERYREGVELIAKQLQDFLKKRGVTPIDAVGADFDPHVHQAVVQEVSSTHREGEVISELRRGYRLGDRLLRPSMVKVAKREQA